MFQTCPSSALLRRTLAVLTQHPQLQSVCVWRWGAWNGDNQFEKKRETYLVALRA